MVYSLPQRCIALCTSGEENGAKEESVRDIEDARPVFALDGWLWYSGYKLMFTINFQKSLN